MGSVELGLIVAGGAGVIVLLAMLINLFRQMTRFALAVGAVMALLVVGVVALSLVNWPTLLSPSLEIVHVDGNGQPVQNRVEQPSAPSIERGTPAAVAVRRFLVGLIVAGVIGAVSVVVGRSLWKNYQRRERIQDALTQAQMYALMSGQRQQLAAGMGRRRGQQGGNVIVVGGQQQETQSVGGDLWEFAD